MASLYQSPNMNFFEADSHSSLDFSDVIFFPENETESTLLQASKKISKTSKASTKKNKRTRNVWTPTEDLMLIELMKKHGQNWAMISSELPGRSGKQIRDRYLNKLRPNIKCGDWTVEEDELFIRLYKQAGNKWTYIASRLEGRTEEQVKNRFYSSLKKRMESDDASCKVSPHHNARKGSVPSIDSLDSLSLPEDSESESMPYSVNTLTAFDERPFDQEPVFPQSQGSINFYYNSYGSVDQDLYSERSTTQCSVSPCDQGNFIDPTDVISYSISEPYLNKQCSNYQPFHIPQVQHDQQIDDLLSRLTNYYVESSDCVKPSSTYGGNEMFVQGGQFASLKCNPESQLAQLNKRKNLIEFILTKTKQSIDQFKCLVPN